MTLHDGVQSEIMDPNTAHGNHTKRLLTLNNLPYTWSETEYDLWSRKGIDPDLPRLAKNRYLELPWFALIGISLLIFFLSSGNGLE